MDLLPQKCLYLSIQLQLAQIRVPLESTSEFHGFRPISLFRRKNKSGFGTKRRDIFVGVS